MLFKQPTESYLFLYMKNVKPADKLRFLTIRSVTKGLSLELVCEETFTLLIKFILKISHRGTPLRNP